MYLGRYTFFAIPGCHCSRPPLADTLGRHFATALCSDTTLRLEHLCYTIESTKMPMLYIFFATDPCSMTPSATSRMDLRRSIAVF